MPSPDEPARSAEVPIPWRDPSERLPRRFALWIWILIAGSGLAVYLFMYSVVHVYVDMRACLTTLPDPLFAIIAKDDRWYLVSRKIFIFITLGSTVALFVQAWRGDHRPVLRWGMGLTIQAVLRCLTITLIPLCRITVKPGTARLTEAPMLDLGLFEIPWRPFASNDLVFSGHVGEFLLLYWATRSWPKPVRVVLVIFQIAQAYALIATRGHYTVDILLALPCAFFADGVGVELLALMSRRKRNQALAAARS